MGLLSPMLVQLLQNEDMKICTYKMKVSLTVFPIDLLKSYKFQKSLALSTVTNSLVTTAHIARAVLDGTKWTVPWNL